MLVDTGVMFWPQWLWPDDPFSKVLERELRRPDLMWEAQEAWRAKPPAVLLWLQTQLPWPMLRAIHVSVLETPGWRQAQVLERTCVNTVVGWGWVHSRDIRPEGGNSREVVALLRALSRDWFRQFLQAEPATPVQLERRWPIQAAVLNVGGAAGAPVAASAPEPPRDGRPAAAGVAVGGSSRGCPAEGAGRS